MKEHHLMPNTTTLLSWFIFRSNHPCSILLSIDLLTTVATTEENIPLRVEGTLRTSLSSLGEQAYYRDSHSTISGRGGGGGAVDYLGRPVLNNNSRRLRERLLHDRDEESRLRVENYVRNSNMSLETRFQPPLMPSSYPIQSTEVVRHVNGSLHIVSSSEGGGSRQSSLIKTPQLLPPMSSCPPVILVEEEVDEGLGDPANGHSPQEDQYSETSSSQVSYPNSNGSLRPKIRPLTPIVSPHASLVHKAQILTS
uniref:Uncharacterized protein n=1 Tax=Knipowitschia caucasica TaxID=637954 RepID=A0AAV2KNA6_KNICA